MKRVNILDCTLRDGAYLIDSQFGNTAIKGIIEGLTESGIDVIECGFLKDEPHREGTTIFNNAHSSAHFYLQTKGIHLMSALPITADTILIT